MPTTTARRALRDLLDTHQLVVAPGVFDGLSAQLAKRSGHRAAYLTGAGVAACGLPPMAAICISRHPGGAPTPSTSKAR